MLGNNSENPAHTQYSGVQGAALGSPTALNVLSPTSHYIDSLLADTKLDSPSADPRFLHQESSYTSGFFLRTEVDKFDFDHSLKHPEPSSASIDALVTPLDQDQDQDLQTTISAVSAQLHGMIDLIDGALSQGKTSTDLGSPVTLPHDLAGPTLDILQSVRGLREIAAQDAARDAFAWGELPPAPTHSEPRYGRVDIQEHLEGGDGSNGSPLADVHDPKVLGDSCSRLNNYGVILLRWPESVAQLWEEYTRTPSEWSREYLTYFLVNVRKISEIDGCEIDIGRILQRRSSIQELEDKFSSGWRSTDKNFSRQINRRKKIWKAIEEGLADGVSLADCEYVLTQYAQEVGKGLSMYYKGVPFRIAERLSAVRARTR